MIVMLVWIVVTYFWSSVHAIGSLSYECGGHGRFEYCIDGIPGCVVGCHCHPGYYFDTETKICEPNANLVHEYRRLYQPTHTPPTPRRSHQALLTTTPATSSKDTDELGNWLYNQFFKTIESHVVNQTDETSDKPTRRSGGLSRPSRRSRRKKSKKMSSLKKKLLRIAKDKEDDLSSDYDSSDNSSSEDDDSSDSESESVEHTPSPHAPSGTTRAPSHHHKDDEEHGHRRVIVINKKPKPPLPSFVFLPNYETPFYPPIGLPPPPAMPMYPMVPVPPMVPFPGAMPQQPSYNSTPQNIWPPPPGPVTSPSPPPPPPPDQQPPPSQQPPPDQQPKQDHQPPTNQQPPPPSLDEPPPETPGHIKRSGRHKKGMRPFSHLNPKYRQQFNRRSGQPEEEPWGDMINPDRAKPPELNDVNFEYLTQLIHKTGVQNNTKHSDTENNRSSLTENIDKAKPYPTNSGNENTLMTRRLLDDPEQEYYSALGQKIASLIRKVDAKRDQQNDAVIPAQNMQDPIQQYSLLPTHDSYSPQSFWERFARSPIPIKSFTRELFPDNDETLIDLESEVEHVARHEKPLSLGELENALFLASKTKSQNHHSINNGNANGYNPKRKPIWTANFVKNYMSDESDFTKSNRSKSYDTDSNRSWNVNLLNAVENRYYDQNTKRILKDQENRYPVDQDNTKNSENRYIQLKKAIPSFISQDNRKTLGTQINRQNNLQQILQFLEETENRHHLHQDDKNVSENLYIQQEKPISSFISQDNRKTLGKQVNSYNNLQQILKYFEKTKNNYHLNPTDLQQEKSRPLVVSQDNRKILGAQFNSQNNFQHILMQNFKNVVNEDINLNINNNADQIKDVKFKNISNKNINFANKTLAGRKNLPHITSNMRYVGPVIANHQLGIVGYPTDKDLAKRKAYVLQKMRILKEIPKKPRTNSLLLRDLRYPGYFTDDDSRQYYKTRSLLLTAAMPSDKPRPLPLPSSFFNLQSEPYKWV